MAATELDILDSVVIDQDPLAKWLALIKQAGGERGVKRFKAVRREGGLVLTATVYGKPLELLVDHGQWRFL